MARMLCLAIGVGDAPPLDYLRGAVNGAHAVAQWANAAGYETLCLTDEKEPLEVAHVKAALERLLAGQPAERLLIHFAGHGVSQGAAEELWLLSQWKTEQEAVSVAGLRRRLERFGIRQLAIVSDACRNVATEAETVALDRRSVLGLGPEAEAVPQTDIFYASSNRRVAYMVGSKDKARCIFTSVMVEGLLGVDDAAFDGGSRASGISSSSLARYLLDRVPKVAATYGVELRPDPRPGFWPPDDKWVPGHPNP
ncbi:caspase family protein, partial [Thermaurantiacus sp.]